MNKLNNTTAYGVGTIVKSYDFPATKTCFIIGRVISEDNGLEDMMCIEAFIRVFDGKDVSAQQSAKHYYVARPGSATFDWPDRIEIL